MVYQVWLDGGQYILVEENISTKDNAFAVSEKTPNSYVTSLGNLNSRYIRETNDQGEGFKLLIDGDIIPATYQYKDFDSGAWKDGDLSAGKVWRGWSHDPIRVPVELKIKKWEK